MQGAAVAAILGLALGGTNAARTPAGGTETPATPTDLTPPVAHNSPVLAEDPTEPRFVAMAHRLDAPDFGCDLQISGDGGGSWIGADPVPLLPEGVDHCYAPDIAFGPDGTLHYLFVGLAGAGNEPIGAYLTRSTDFGRTFSRPQRLLGPRNFAVRLASDPRHGDHGRLHLVWLHARTDPPLGGFGPPPNPIMTAYSEDGGRTFSDPVRVSDPDRPRAVAPALEVGPDGRVHVAYLDLRGDARDYRGLEGPVWEGTWSLVVATSRDGGRSFSSGVEVDDRLIPPERVLLIFTTPPPALAVARDGRVHVAWHDARNGDWDVFASHSPDGGVPWSSPTRLNDDPVENGHHQYLPGLDVATTGRVDAVFYDRRRDPQNVRNHLYHSYSDDGGLTFSGNVRLTSRSSDTRIGQRYLVPSAKGRHEFGSHPAVLSRSDQVVAAWTDTRNAGRGTNQQDIFTTVRSIAEPRQGRWWLRMVAGLAVLGATVGAISVVRRGWHRPPDGDWTPEKLASNGVLTSEPAVGESGRGTPRHS